MDRALEGRLAAIELALVLALQLSLVDDAFASGWFARVEPVIARILTGIDEGWVPAPTDPDARAAMRSAITRLFEQAGEDLRERPLGSAGS